MNYTLNEAEQKLAQHLSKRRYEHARSNGIKDLKMGEQSNYETDLEGVAAEIAFSKLANVYPDLDIGLTKDWDVIYKGFKIDVKVSKYKTAKLLATLKKTDCDIDYYVLLTGVFPGPYTLRGVARKCDLIQAKNVSNLGRGNGYMLEQKDLKSFDTI